LFCASPEYKLLVRQIDQGIKVTNATLTQVPFDLQHWQEVAAEGDMPTPTTDDPTQWLFNGHPVDSIGTLQVAVSRLVGYHWPDQPDDDGLDSFADGDGIVCLPSVLGEAPAADRLQALLAAAYGKRSSPAKLTELLEQTGGTKRKLAEWLQAEFF